MARIASGALARAALTIGLALSRTSVVAVSGA